MKYIRAVILEKADIAKLMSGECVSVKINNEETVEIHFDGAQAGKRPRGLISQEVQNLLEHSKEPITQRDLVQSIPNATPGAVYQTLRKLVNSGMAAKEGNGYVLTNGTHG